MNQTDYIKINQSPLENGGHISRTDNSGRRILIGRYFWLFLYLFILFLVIPVHNIIQILDSAKYLHFRLVLSIGIGHGLHFFIVSSHIAIFD